MKKNKTIFSVDNNNCFLYDINDKIYELLLEDNLLEAIENNSPAINWKRIGMENHITIMHIFSVESINNKIYNFIKSQILDEDEIKEYLDFLSFDKDINLIIIKYDNRDELNYIYDLLSNLYNKYFEYEKEMLIKTLSEEEYSIRKKISELKDYIYSESNFVIPNLFNENTIVNQKETEIWNIIVIGEERNNFFWISVFIEDEKGIHFLIYLNNYYKDFINLRIWYFKNWFNTIVKINKDWSININNNSSYDGRKLYMKKNFYFESFSDSENNYYEKEHAANYATNLLEYSFKKVEYPKNKEEEILIYKNLYEPFLYINEKKGIEKYNLLLRNNPWGSHWYEISLFIKNGEIGDKEERHLDTCNYCYSHEKLFNNKYIYYYFQLSKNC